jgi:predicted permease
MAFVSALLVATTLVVTTFVVISTADLGFDRRNLMALGVQKSLEAGPPGPASGAAIRAALLRRVAALPGVTGAALIRNGVPLSGGPTNSLLYAIPGRERRQTVTVITREATPEYFSTMGLQLVRGRAIDASDGPGAPRVVVINDTAASRYFPGTDPVGQVLDAGGPVTIIGIVHGMRMSGPEIAVEPEFYMPIDQGATASAESVELVVRTAGAAAALAPRVRETAKAALGDGEIFEARLIEENFRRLTAGRRFNARLMAIFGVLALLIGAIGVYGTMAFIVAQDVRAVGLRLALGATPARIRACVIRETIGRVVTGVGIGLAGAWMASSLFTSLVFGVATTHPVVYGGVAVIIAAVGVLAALMPAVRASRLDPLVALKSE